MACSLWSCSVRAGTDPCIRVFPLALVTPLAPHSLSRANPTPTGRELVLLAVLALSDILLLAHASAHALVALDRQLESDTRRQCGKWRFRSVTRRRFGEVQVREFLCSQDRSANQMALRMPIPNPDQASVMLTILSCSKNRFETSNKKPRAKIHQAI